MSSCFLNIYCVNGGRKVMLEFLKWVFSDFWIFVGFVIILEIVVSPLQALGAGLIKININKG
jgi:hypothetical protein